EMSVESGVLYVKAAGLYSLEEAKKALVETIKAAAQHRVKKVLFDGRAVEGDPELMERFSFGEFAARTVMNYFVDNSRSPLFECVFKEPMLGPGRFTENVMVNRGMPIKAFDNVEQARTWLGLHSTKTD